MSVSPLFTRVHFASSNRGRPHSLGEASLRDGRLHRRLAPGMLVDAVL